MSGFVGFGWVVPHVPVSLEFATADRYGHSSFPANLRNSALAVGFLLHDIADVVRALEPLPSPLCWGMGNWGRAGNVAGEVKGHGKGVVGFDGHQAF